jgi:hypothetical protein
MHGATFKAHQHVAIFASNALTVLAPDGITQLVFQGWRGMFVSPINVFHSSTLGIIL